MDFKFVSQLPPGVQDSQTQEKPLSANAIPNLEKLLDSILELLRYINTDEMQKMETDDQQAFEQHVDAKFNDLSIRYYSIFRLLMDKEHREENVHQIIDMISKLKEIKEGKVDIEKATKDYTETKNQAYIYPKWGGKEQFEKAMREEEKKNKGKKKK